jgi:hypothetical protein
MTPWVRKWVRIELRSRSNDVSESVKARLHDPAWLLARQYQMGELQGEDAGSPTVVRYSSRELEADHVELRGSSGKRTVPIDRAKPVPLEVLVEREMPSVTFFQRLRLGRMFEKYLLEHDRGVLFRGLWRQALPLKALQLDVDPTATERAVAVSRTLAGRCVDGGAIIAALKGGEAGAQIYDVAVGRLNEVPGADSELRLGTALMPEFATHFNECGSRLAAWWNSAFCRPDERASQDLQDNGELHDTAWVDEHLEYQAAVTLSDPSESITLRTQEYFSGRLDWHDFEKESASASDGSPTTRHSWVIPDAVRFPGQPHDRFWQLENSDVNWGATPLDRRDVPRLVLAEYALVYGNDWFWTPIGVRAGTALSVDHVHVFDSFGRETILEPASTISNTWRMFDVEADPSSGRCLLFVPPTVLGGAESKPIETVHLIRDTAANMAWGIEETVEGELGFGVSGTDLAQARRSRKLQRYLDELQRACEAWLETRSRLRDFRGNPPFWASQQEAQARLAALRARAEFVRMGGDLRDADSELPVPDGVAGLPTYRFMQPIPENQIPFVPVVPEPITDLSRLRLRRYALPDIFGSDALTPERVRAKGVILRPDKRPFYIYEEEVPAEAVRVVRTNQLVRTSDGRRILWIGRRKGPVMPKRHASTKNDRVVNS